MVVQAKPRQLQRKAKNAVCTRCFVIQRRYQRVEQWNPVDGSVRLDLLALWGERPPRCTGNSQQQTYIVFKHILFPIIIKWIPWLQCINPARQRWAISILVSWYACRMETRNKCFEVLTDRHPGDCHGAKGWACAVSWGCIAGCKCRSH